MRKKIKHCQLKFILSVPHGKRRKLVDNYTSDNTTYYGIPSSGVHCLFSHLTCNYCFSLPLKFGSKIMLISSQPLLKRVS